MRKANGLQKSRRRVAGVTRWVNNECDTATSPVESKIDRML